MNPLMERRDYGGNQLDKNKRCSCSAKCGCNSAPVEKTSSGLDYENIVLDIIKRASV